MPFTPFDLTGKVSLITGGNGGIGLGMALGMAQAGSDICIWGTNLEKNKFAQKTIQDTGVQCLAIQCDVSDEEQVEQSFSQTITHFGKVDSCFANAGAGGGVGVR